MPVDSTAAVLADRVNALAAALRDAGISPDRAAALLDSASAATRHALTLVALLQPAPAVPDQAPAERQLALAA